MKGLLSLGMVIKLGAGTLCVMRGVVQVVGLLLLQTCVLRGFLEHRCFVFCVGQSSGHKRKYRKKKFILFTGPRETVTLHSEGVTWEGVSRDLTQPNRWEAEDRARTEQVPLLGGQGRVHKTR